MAKSEANSVEQEIDECIDCYEEMVISDVEMRFNYRKALRGIDKVTVTGHTARKNWKIRLRKQILALIDKYAADFALAWNGDIPTEESVLYQALQNSRK